MSSLDYPWSAEAALSRNEAPWKRFSALTRTFALSTRRRCIVKETSLLQYSY